MKEVSGNAAQVQVIRESLGNASLFESNRCNHFSEGVNEPSRKTRGVITPPNPRIFCREQLLKNRFQWVTVKPELRRSLSYVSGARCDCITDTELHGEYLHLSTDFAGAWTKQTLFCFRLSRSQKYKQEKEKK